MASSRDLKKSGRGVGLSLERISHSYGGTLAVDDVSLAISPGELTVLLGPSGCGKTTLLRIIAGLVKQSAGRVVIGDQVVDALPSSERAAGIVFQNYALFPHMTVAANVAYGLRARGVQGSTIRETVGQMLKLVRLDALEHRYPQELSGGQQQRVALARTLAVSPRVLLLDEPFGALDKNLRLDMQIEIKRLQRELDITTIMVTHDQSEAMSMADRIAVMSAGKLDQFAPPQEIYDAPATPFVAAFVGTTNLLRGVLRPSEHGFHVHLAGEQRLCISRASPYSSAGDVVLVARPEHFRLNSSTAEGLAAEVRTVLPYGPYDIYELTLPDGAPLKVSAVRSGMSQGYAPGSRVRVELVPGAAVRVFAAW